MQNCIACDYSEIVEILDLGKSALANKFLTKDELGADEPRHPLVVGTCARCGHVQLIHHVPPEALFDDYLYISSLSTTLVNHLRDLARTMVERNGLGADDLVVDIGSNDGTLLRGFKDLGIKTLGVDPAKNLQSIAAKNGIETIVDYFGIETAKRIVAKNGQASVITATNVFPHVPRFDDFLNGAKLLLQPGGTFVLEAHYLGDLISQVAFDTVYHEHVSYWSLSAARTLFNRFGFEVVGITRLPVHHGQLRLYVQHRGQRDPGPDVKELLAQETQTGLLKLDNLMAFAGKVARIKSDLNAIIAKILAEGKAVAAYGAPAKGTTLMTFVGLGPNQIRFVADKSPLKQNRYTPGTHIPVVGPERLLSDQPDYVLLMAWNFADEIMREQAEYIDRGGRFILPVPEVRVV